jgi:uroporphyrinogen decarboxylase
MNHMEDLKACIAGRVSKAPLIFPIFEAFLARQAGVSYHDYSTNAVVIARAWDYAIEYFHSDWAGLFIDDLFEYDMLGVETGDGPDRPYAVTKYLPAERSTLDRLRIPNPKNDGRMPLLLEAQKRIRDRWGDRIIINKSVAAPFSGLTLLYGINDIMLIAYDNPEFLKKSMTFMEELVITWGRALLEGGTDVFWLGDASASSRLLSMDMYREFAMEPARRVISALKQMGGIVIYHAAENRLPFLEATAEIGADILSVEAGIDLAAVKKAVGHRVALSGNLDGIKEVWQGQPQDIERKARQLVNDVASQGGVIVNTGEGIPKQTPVENVRAMIRGIREAWPRNES